MPIDLAFHPQDSKILYIADTGNHRIAKVDFHGSTPVVSTYVGVPGTAGEQDGPGDQALFDSPYSLVIMDDGTMFVADRESGNIRKIAPDGTVSTIANIPNIQVIRQDSKGDLIAAVPEDNGVYRITPSSGSVELITTVPQDKTAWLWLDVDRWGSIGVKDAIYIHGSRPGVGIGGDYNSNVMMILPDGSVHDWLPHTPGPIRSGVIEYQQDVFGHYPWAIAISPTEGRVITSGFGSLGVSSLRLRQPSDPAPPTPSEVSMFNRGRKIHERGTVDDFPTDSRPPFSAIHGPRGHSRLGNVLNYDDLSQMTDDQIADYIHKGMGGSVPRPEITGNDLRDYIYFIRRSSLQGELTTIQPGASNPDSIPPEIRNIHVTQLDSTTVKISWQTDEPTLGLAEYGPSQYYGLWSEIESSYSKNHEIVLSHLSPGGQHHFSIISKDWAGNSRISANQSFQMTSMGNLPTPVSATLDFGQPGYSETGTGWTDRLGGYGNTFRSVSSGTGQNTATWFMTGLSEGQYVIQATWVSSPNNATNATYRIYDGDTLVDTAVVNQKIPPAGKNVNGITFSTLTTRTLTSGNLKVVLSDVADGDVIADAIIVVRI